MVTNLWDSIRFIYSRPNRTWENCRTFIYTIL